MTMQSLAVAWLDKIPMRESKSICFKINITSCFVLMTKEVMEELPAIINVVVQVIVSEPLRLT